MPSVDPAKLAALNDLPESELRKQLLWCEAAADHRTRRTDTDRLTGLLVAQLLLCFEVGGWNGGSSPVHSHEPTFQQQ